MMPSVSHNFSLVAYAQPAASSPVLVHIDGLGGSPLDLRVTPVLGAKGYMLLSPHLLFNAASAATPATAACCNCCLLQLLLAAAAAIVAATTGAAAAAAAAVFRHRIVFVCLPLCVYALRSQTPVVD